MALQVNDWIWLRLSSRYGVSPAEAQVGDVFKRWLDERGGTWGYSLVDFYFGKTTLPTSYADAEYAYWSGGALKDAAFWIDAFSASGTSVTNLGSGGSALNARYGSTSGVDIADPVLLTHTGTNYLYTTGVVGNNASVPNLAAYQLSEFDIQVDVDLGGNPAALSSLLAMWNTGALGYGLHVSSGGFLQLYGSPDGTANTFVASSVAATLTGRILLRCTRRTSDGRVQFFTAPPSASPVWTQLGTDQFLYAGLSLFASTQPLRVGQNGGSQPTTGKFYSAKLIADPFGTPTTVFFADFTTGITSGAQVTFTESSVNAATVTINRSLSGRKSVAVVRPVWLFGTDDFMEAAADPYGAYVRTTSLNGGSVETAHTTYDTGTATAGAATTLDDTAKAWTASAYISRVVRITGGTGVGQVRVITANTATQLTVTPAWTTIPDATSTYVIESRGNVTDDIQIVVRCALDNWATGANQPLVVKRNVTTQYSYYLYMSSGGVIGFAFSLDGTSFIALGSGVAPFTNGTPYWIRFRRTASTGAWTIDYAADQATEPSTWTALSSGTTTAGTMWQGTAPIGIGGSSTIGWSNGKFYFARVNDGFAGNAVAYWLAYGHPAGGNYVNANKVLWTLGANASVVNPNPLNFGANDSYTIVTVQRTWATPVTSGTIASKWSGGGGYNVRNGFGTPTQPLIAFNDNNTSQAVATTPPTLGAVTVLSWVVEPTQVTPYMDNTTFAPVARSVFEGSASEVAFRLGSTSAGGSFNDYELLAAAVIPKALTAADIAKIVAAYQ